MNAAAAIALALLGACGTAFYACFAPTSQLLGRSLVRGPAKDQQVALTFDDGPASPFTEQILDILHETGVSATFFVCGKNAARYPDTLRRIREEGHTIGNHTYTHPFLWFKSRSRMASEIDRTQDVIEQLVGLRPKLFRPPYGIRWFGLFPLLRERRMTDVQWSDAGFDWVAGNSPEEVIRRSLAKLRAGSILLLHDGREPRPPEHVDASVTVAALPAIIEGVWKKGLSFVSVEDFLPSDGQVS
jgi:peptidoglycan/xylan/chitin deacetylase (PgdA/CDA1 family)